LYRLQRGQLVTDLEPTTLDSLEASYAHQSPQFKFQASLYAMRKRNDIFRDAEGFNVSEGETRHVGIELDLHWAISEQWLFSGNLSHARHTYDFNRVASGGESIRSGNSVDTAPEWLGAMRFRWQPGASRYAEAEWAYTGEYWLDAANLHRYGGHRLLNLRAGFGLSGGRHHLGIRLSNLLNDYFAERADFAFGNYRYFPGAGRQIFIHWAYRP
jgi:outer membrane receptor protein involved in Fe transport